jgi:hypothetical protein
VEKVNQESENVCRIYVKVQALLGAQDRVREPTSTKVCTWCMPMQRLQITARLAQGMYGFAACMYRMGGMYALNAR